MPRPTHSGYALGSDPEIHAGTDRGLENTATCSPFRRNFRAAIQMTSRANAQKGASAEVLDCQARRRVGYQGEVVGPLIEVTRSGEGSWLSRPGHTTTSRRSTAR